MANATMRSSDIGGQAQNCCWPHAPLRQTPQPLSFGLTGLCAVHSRTKLFDSIFSIWFQWNPHDSVNIYKMYKRKCFGCIFECDNIRATPSMDWVGAQKSIGTNFSYSSREKLPTRPR